MTPKEKAKELVLKFAFKGAQHEGEAKQFALIAVNEIIKNIKPIQINLLISTFKLEKDFKDNLEFINNHITKNLINEKIYWQEVKQEIELL